MHLASLELGHVGLTLTQQESVRAGLQQLLQQCDNLRPAQTWSRISKQFLLPAHPFALHALLFKAAYCSWPTNLRGPAPVWIPDEDEAAQTNLAQFMQTFQGNQEWQRGRTRDPQTDWKLLYNISCSDPEVFWSAVMAHLKVPFHAQPQSMVQMSANPDSIRWLPGARLNAAEAALSRQPDEATAIVWAEEAAPSQLASMTMAELRQQCRQVAAALHAAGFQPGDAIAINMPMTVHAVVIYLAIIYAGCAAVSIADSFAPSEISTRIEIAQSKAIFVQDVILRGGRAHPLYQRVVQAKGPKAIVLPASKSQGLQVNLREGDTSFEDFLSGAESPHTQAPHIVDACETCNILFSSGTTGQPKAIPWTHLTPLRCAANAFFHHDVRQGDTVAWPTNLGWMMGPWLVFAALLNGATIALFQGSPLGRDFGTFVQQAGVSMLGLVPSIAKTWQASDCMKGLRWDKLRCFSSTGEASSPEDYHWLSAMAGYKPIIEYCGGTEIGGGFLSGTLVQPQAPSHFSTPTIGSRLALIDDQQVLFDSLTGPIAEKGSRSQAGVTGELALVPPLLGSSQRLLNKSHFQVYYEGMPKLPGTAWPLRRHGDQVESLPGGFFVAHGRCDDTMNLGGIKVSSVELERVVIASVPAVLEAAAVALTPPGGGPEQLIMFLVLDRNASTAAPSLKPSSDPPSRSSSQQQSQKQDSSPGPVASSPGPVASSRSQSASAAPQGSDQGHEGQSNPGRQPTGSSTTPGASRALTKAPSIAAAAVEAVRSAAAPLLAQAQSVMAPLTAKLQAAAADAQGAAAPAVRQAQAIAGAMAADVADAAAPVTDQVQAAALPLAEKAKTALTGAAEQTRDAASTAYESTGSSATGAVQAAGLAVKQAQAAPVLDQAKAAVATVAEQSRETGAAAYQAVSTSASISAQRVQSAVAPAAEASGAKIGNAASAAWDGIRSGTDSLTDQLRSSPLAPAIDQISSIAAAARDSLQSSKDSVTEQLSDSPIAPAIAQITSTAAAVKDQAAQAATAAVNAVRDATASVTAKVDSSEDATEVIASTASSAKDAGSQARGQAAATAKRWAAEAATAAKADDIGAQVKNNVSSKVQAAGQQAQKVVSTASAGAQQAVLNAQLMRKDEAASRTAAGQVERTADAAGQLAKGTVTGAKHEGQSVRETEGSASIVNGGDDLEQLKAACQKAIRTNLNPLFKLQRVLLRDSLPRTASNKVMRRVLRDELRQCQAKL